MHLSVILSSNFRNRPHWGHLWVKSSRMNTMLLTSKSVAPFISFPDQFFKSGFSARPQFTTNRRSG
jgi:hypothetical protein